MTQDLFDYAQARARADDGIQRAVTHADAVEPSWSDRALNALLWYASATGGGERPGPFLIEDMRACAYLAGLPPPPDGRAWGAVVQRAARAGHIVQVGFERAKSSNCSPKCLWERGEA